jgi:hypothetical protein
MAYTSNYPKISLQSRIDRKIWGFYGGEELWGSCKKGRFGGSYRLYHQGQKNQRTTNKVSN